MVRLLVILGLLWSFVAPIAAESPQWSTADTCAACCPLCTPASCPCEVSEPDRPATPDDRQAPPARSFNLISQARPDSAVFSWNPNAAAARTATEPVRARLARAPSAALLCVWTT